MPEYRVLRIDEQLYGCEELPAGQPVLCDVTLTDAAGAARILPYPDKELTRLGIDEGDTVCLLPDGTPACGSSALANTRARPGTVRSSASPRPTLPTAMWAAKA